MNPPLSLHALHSSLRMRSAEESLPLAAAVARSRGILRVFETTRFDRIGIPVFVSVRPDAADGTLSVYAGKGFTPAEARIGAYMEAIEYSFSAPGCSAVEFHLADPADIVHSFQGRISLPEFIPVLGRQLQSGDQLAVVQAEEFASGLGTVLVPAERVFFPFPDNPGRRLYNTDGNGLASGNTVQEATVHALSEVMERDIRAHILLGAPSQLVRPDSLSPLLRGMLQRIEDAGLSCHLRYSANAFGQPFFAAYVLDPPSDRYDLMSLTSGYGLHVSREIAAVRAVAEAVQSRSLLLHGGRCDLAQARQAADQLDQDKVLVHSRRLRAAYADATRSIGMADIPDTPVRSLQQAQDVLLDGLRRAGLPHAARVVFTEPDFPFQVVRVVVPGAECFSADLHRAGPRMAAFLRASRPEVRGAAA